MSKYIKKADRHTATAEAYLASIVDDPNATPEQKQDAANRLVDLRLIREKAVPVRSALAERIKLQRTAERQRDVLAAELSEAKQRITTLESVEQELTAAKAEITQLTTQRDRANETANNATSRATTATGTADAYKRSVTAIVETLFPEQTKRLTAGARLFFKNQHVAPEVFRQFGIDVVEWRKLDSQFRTPGQMLDAWENNNLKGADDKPFVQFKLLFQFDTDVKEELENRAAERKAAVEAEKKASAEWLQEQAVKAVEQKKSDDMEARIRAAEQPRPPHVLVWGRDVR